MEEYVGILFYKEYCLENNTSFYRPQKTIVGEKVVENDLVGIDDKQQKYFEFKGDNDIICDVIIKKEDLEKNYSDLKTFEEKIKAFFNSYQDTLLMTTVIENKNYSRLFEVSSLKELIVNNEFCMVEASVIELWKESIDKGNFKEVQDSLIPIYNMFKNLSHGVTENKEEEIDSVDVLNNYNK